MLRLDGQGYLSVVRDRERPARRSRQWTTSGSVPCVGLGLVWSRLRLGSLFDHACVTGTRQQRFARKLGFDEPQIHECLYVANAINFDPIWQGFDGAAPNKRLVFTGRYAPEKGLDVLWDAFQSYHAGRDSALELWCIGKVRWKR